MPPRSQGKGYGGPAKGTRPAFTADNQPPAVLKSVGHDVAREMREMIAARRKELIAAQFDRALNPDHPQGHAAAKDLMDRIMPPKQEISGPEGGAMRIERVIVDPVTDRDAEGL